MCSLLFKREIQASRRYRLKSTSKNHSERQFLHSSDQRDVREAENSDSFLVDRSKIRFSSNQSQGNGIEKAPFPSKYRHYEFLAMQMRLAIAPTILQMLMTSVFIDLIDDFVVAYKDDLLIFND